MAELYRVIISGRTVSGRPLNEVFNQVGAAFKLQGDQLAQMLCGRPVVVVKSATGPVAEQWLARLRDLDLEAMRQPLAPTAPVVEAPATPTAPATPANVAAEIIEAATPATAAAPTVETAVEEIVCPKCGEAQPKRTLCRQCGLDMPRYLLAQQQAAEEAREQLTAQQAGPARSPGIGAGAGLRQPAAMGIDGASLVGIGFSGRLGRLDYLASGFVATVIWLAGVLLAVSTGQFFIAGLGIFIGLVYAVRCLALRLHDTGHSGWLSLVAAVPIVGVLMSLALFFIPGSQDDNDYGAPPHAGGGKRLLISLVVSGLMLVTAFKQMTRSPENLIRFAQATAIGSEWMAPPHPDDDEEDEGSGGNAMPPVTRYAASNQVDLYVIPGCGSCDQMHGWLRANGIQPAVYNVDGDPQAAEQLHDMLGGGAQHIMLPVLRVNGKVLPGNPDINLVHNHLRPAS